MKSDRLENMIKGWFVGNFDPVVLRNENFEVAVKYYKAGDCEETHYHKIATEVTVIVSGTVEMCGKIWEAGDIVVVEPGEATGFYALTDSVNVVVKTPSAPNDKYIATV